MTCDMENWDIARSSEGAGSAAVGLPEGIPPLASLYMYLTDVCNLRCRHCWISPEYDPEGRNGHFLKREYIEKAINEANPLGLASIKLTGGEPFLHPDIKEILSLINSRSLKIIIESNGTRIDADMAKFLSRLDTFTSISVSVDGVDAATHEWFRGVSGSFDQAIAGIKNLVTQRIYPQLICSLHQRNASQIENMIHMAASLGCSSIKFNHIQPVGRGKTVKENLRISPDKIFELYTMVEEQFIKISRIPIFFDVPYAFKRLRQLVYDPLGRCHVKNILGILADGRISICGIGEAVPELVFGNVAKESLRAIWLTHPILQELREVVPGNLQGVCADCIHRNFCMGHCVAQTFYMSKKLNSPFWVCEYARKNNKFPDNRLKGN